MKYQNRKCKHKLELQQRKNSETCLIFSSAMLPSSWSSVLVILQLGNHQPWTIFQFSWIYHHKETIFFFTKICHKTNNEGISEVIYYCTFQNLTGTFLKSAIWPDLLNKRLNYDIRKIDKLPFCMQWSNFVWYEALIMILICCLLCWPHLRRKILRIVGVIKIINKPRN